MIVINNLIKTYNNRAVVDIPHLRIRQATVTGVVGNNGAGKTTLFRLLLDLVRANEGEVLSQGQDVAEAESWKSYTAAYLDETFLPGYLTPEEYFYFVGKLHRLSKTEVNARLQGIDTFLGEGVLNSGKYIRDLSRGNQAKVGISACILQKPAALILDEPFANLDPTSQLMLVDMLRQLSDTYGMTILVSSHDLNHVTGLCNWILLMERGTIIKDIDTGADTLQELAAYFKTSIFSNNSFFSARADVRR